MEASSKNWKGSMEVAISSRGASGGLCTLWHSSFYDAVQIRNNQHWIYTELVCKRTGKHFQFLSIYAPTLYREKQYCWQFLFSFQDSIYVESTIIAGDFNLVLAQGEKGWKSSQRSVQRESRGSHSGLGSGLHKTQEGQVHNKYEIGPGHIAARLDRFLVHSGFLVEGLYISSNIIASAASDHRPISLTMQKGINYGPLPFRFNHLWLQDRSALELIEEVWKMKVEGSPCFIWE